MAAAAPSTNTIMYTFTDEAPMLATHAFYPILQAFLRQAGLSVELKDLSLAGRVLATFPEKLSESQRVPDALAELGELVRAGGATIIKLPNISASVPQLKACLQELQGKGFALPDFPEAPQEDAGKALKVQFGKVLGSAVNPVLREGNSDRRAAVPVKGYAAKFPHSMGAWSKESKTHVSSMQDGDFYSHEKSVRVEAGGDAKIELTAKDGSVTVLKDKLSLQTGDVVDATFMDCRKLRAFFEEQVADAKAKNVLFSLHLKATMMKISDPIMFGHCVRAFYKDVFEKHGAKLAELGADPNNGLGDIYKKISSLPEADKAALEADIQAVYAKNPPIAMVNSDKGITNLHVPSDIIIDNSMPTALRGGGKMWGPGGDEADFKAVIPDRSYAGVFGVVVDFCKANGAFDPKTMGSCPNVGLMAQKAEEYGSHPTTFEAKQDGVIRVVQGDKVLHEHTVQEGDIWRACITRDAPIRDWVKLAVRRCRANDFVGNEKPCKAIFWLDPARAHDALVKQLVVEYLKEHDTAGLDVEILDPVQACQVTCQRAKDGLNTITVTGNVLRDYLTDLFPILELGTSSKMLSIVPMLAGGAMYETGAGGSAPKHVEQFEQEGHLRWDSLGEYLAIQSALSDLGASHQKAKVLGCSLERALVTFLSANKNASRKVKEIDNRGSHYWLARFWAEEVAKQKDDAEMAKTFGEAASSLATNEEIISKELIDCQGSGVDLGGYYRVDKAKVDAAMQPSTKLNEIISRLAAAAKL